mgnify:CR=1 FL=1
MLKEMLSEMIAYSRETSASVHRGLKGGLHLYLNKKTDGFHLVLMRKECYPSLQEWNTVIAFWPWRVVLNPQQKQDGKFNYLVGVIPDRFVYDE